MNKGLFSSKKQDWETPQWLFDKLNKEFNFTLDVCANISDHKCMDYFDKLDNGLMFNWQHHNYRSRKGVDEPGAIWMNPPYGREIIKWIKKAYEESLVGATVVCLLPARVDTQWWHKYVMKAEEIRLIKGRLKFVGSISSAPFPSCIVIFRSPLEQKLNCSMFTTMENK